MKRSLCKLLCLILALGMVIGCFAGCDSASGGRDKDDEEESEQDKLRKDLEEYDLNGLVYYLSDDFDDGEDAGTDTVVHESDDATVTVGSGAMSDVATEDIATSKKFAEYYADMMGALVDDAEVESANDVYYVRCDNEGTITLCGFYVQDGYGWLIMAETEDEDLVEDLIQYVTLGQIDEDFDADDYLSAPGSTDIDTPAPDDYSDIEIDHNPTYDTFTVHAYVPDSWGYPGCWAWSNTTGENVFDAWPGEPMDHVSGYYYTLEIPAWAEYVIVNGNDGTIQTQDEPVEPGSDVWVVISAIDETYNVYFSEPSADELAAFGY